MISRSQIAGLVGALVVSLGAGLALGYYIYQPAPAKPETYAPAQQQADGSLVLERSPRPPEAVKPAAQLPKDGKLERQVQVKVKPNIPAIEAKQGEDKGTMNIDLSLVKMKDDSRRVVASTPDGEVVGGIDIPVEPAKPTPAAPKWAVGLSSNLHGKELGVFIDRDAGPFRIGAEIVRKNSNLIPGQERYVPEVRVKFGVRF